MEVSVAGQKPVNQSLDSRPAETPRACRRKTPHQIQWRGRPWKCTSCPPPPALARQQLHFLLFFKWMKRSQRISRPGRTQFFGYFSIFQGVHHPETNVLVLQDLRCQLKVDWQCQINLASFFHITWSYNRDFLWPCSRQSALCPVGNCVLTNFVMGIIKQASLILHKQGSNNVPWLDLDLSFENKL